jgi:autophagy-related protein 2
MAFFSALSSSIGKKLLLYGLRHIDILDKDPADFVSVDVGKKTTLEVRDVGLHVKVSGTLHTCFAILNAMQKLVALLHLKLPPEIQLLSARASFFRVNFLLEFGVPQIAIEIDGIQVHARLADDTAEPASESRGKERSSPRARSPPRYRAPSPADDASDVSSGDEDYVPNLDDLAKSFIREEPEDEIKELEQELESQSGYLQDSASSSDDGDDESVAGMGAPLALPAYLRNWLNTALDRLSLVVNNIHIELQDQLPTETSGSLKQEEDPYVSLDFHIERIAVDSITSEDAQTSATPPSRVAGVASPNSGKRRLRAEKICARVISDVEDFFSLPRTSRSSSPVDTRSEASSAQKSRSNPASSSGHLRHASTILQQEPVPSLPTTSPDMSVHSKQAETESPDARTSPASVRTTDDDRFADAASDGGLEDSTMSESRESFPDSDLSASSLLYDDDGILDYAMQNDLLGSRLEESQLSVNPRFRDDSHVLNLDGAASSHIKSYRLPEDETTASNLLSVSALGTQAESMQMTDTGSQSNPTKAEPEFGSTDNLDHARHLLEEDQTAVQHARTPSPPEYREEALSQSQLFSHDEAESMYMSAVSGAPMESSHRQHVPGGWESSSSTSSHETSSDTSAPIPASMLAGSILDPTPEGDDGTETPRPSSPQSVFSSPLQTRRTSSEQQGTFGELHARRPKFGKVFLTIDEVTLWFPLALGGEQSSNNTDDRPRLEMSELDFNPPNLAEDSIFQGMPGSFSNYAHSTSTRKKPTAEEPARRLPSSRKPQAEKPAAPVKKATSDVSIEVGTVLGHVDFSTGRVMFQMVHKAMAVLTSGAKEEQKQAGAHEEQRQPDARSSVEFSVKHISISFKDRLPTHSLDDIATARFSLAPSTTDAILKMTISSVQAASQTVVGKTRSKLQIGKLVLSSLDHDIIGFQSARPRSRRLASTAPAQSNNDIEVDYEEGQDRRLTIVTRPVRVMFDLEKLDDALGAFGGFSGVLELSASFTSNHVSSPTLPLPPARPPGVRFSDTPSVPTPTTPSNSPKIQIQLGEVSLHLKGKACAVQLQTSSVRVAIRESNVRLKVSKVNIMGPCIEPDQPEAPLMVEIRDSTVNLVFVPTNADLDRLISIIAPSKDPYESNEDILIDTLLQQRRKGSLLRAEVGSMAVSLSDSTQVQTLGALGEELAKLSKVTKYLPDDDRPGILTMVTVQNLDLSATINERLGAVSIVLGEASIAHVGVPALFAAEMGRVSVKRGDEVLIQEVVGIYQQEHLPMVMVRFVGDEMEPVVKAKLFNVCAEYHVSTIMAALGISDDGTADDLALGLAASVATITRATSPKTLSRQSSASNASSMTSAKPLHIDILLRNCAIGLNPRDTPAKGLFVFTDAHFLGQRSKKLGYAVEVQLRKASVQAVDDAALLGVHPEHPAPSSRAFTTNRQLQGLATLGYVTLGSISAANVLVSITEDGNDQSQQVDVQFKNELFVLESCADSTQTLVAIINGLQPPSSPPTTQQYREQARNVVPIDEMMQSISREAFPGADDDDFMENADLVSDEVPTNLEFVGSFYNQDSLPTEEELGDSLLGEDDLEALAGSSTTRLRGDRGLLESFQERYEVAEGEDEFDFDDNYFKESESEPQGKARKWSSSRNAYHLTNEFKGQGAPLKIRVRDVNVIWNIYEGYDWPRTRFVIAQAVEDVEVKAEQRRQKPQYEDDEDEFVEEDFLFNSVWIGVPVTEEKGALARRINDEINRRPDDQMSETGSYATSTATRSTNATLRPGSASKSSRSRLKLERSKYKRVAFELRGVEVDFVAFPPDTGETVSSIDVRVSNFDIYDHIPKSNWKKFLTCQIDPRERELDRPMVDLEFLTVKPVTGLAASELVIKVHVLPLLLHIDQDALDFIKGFFAFKDTSAAQDSSPSDGPFIQRLEVDAVKVNFHYKPRRIDYRGLRAGRTSELMNIFVLDGAKFTLKHVIVYGIKSFDNLHDTLSDIWTPDVTKNQLPGVLGGLAVVRPLVDVGSGVRDLIYVPVHEYRKDGRIVRSLQKGIFAFATNTTSEVARLGAKVAIGTQNILEGAEKLLNPAQASPGRSSTHHDWDGDDRTVSNYANQPIGMRAGLQSAARHLQRDLMAARDAVIAMPAEVMEDGTGLGMAKVLAKRAPTIVLRPAMGAMKATSNTLLGLGNALDKQSRRKIDDVSAVHSMLHDRWLTRCRNTNRISRSRRPCGRRDSLLCWSINRLLSLNSFS